MLEELADDTQAFATNTGAISVTESSEKRDKKEKKKKKNKKD